MTANDTTTTAPRARLTAAERLAEALLTHSPAPEGYSIRWPKPAFDLLKADAQVEGQPAWLVRCNLHLTTTAAKDTKEGDQLGTKAGRLTWCKGCKADAAKAARAEAKAEAAKATQEG